jgi:predicted acylesterase/phospholipase RssA
MADEQPQMAIVFSGGLGLGAYHAGAFEAFTSGGGPLDWVTGSSAGAITAALIAGSATADRIGNLRRYWHGPTSPTPVPDANRHLLAWLSSINTRLVDHAGFFHPRLPIPASHFGGLYDLGPTRERLQQLIDFERLNAGDLRVTICATDLETGGAVLFNSQTFHRFRHALEARRLRAELQGPDRDDLIWLLSYRPGAEEAGPEKSFDLSEVAMAQRWQAGFLDMQHAAGLAPDKDGICSVRRR